MTRQRIHESETLIRRSIARSSGRLVLLVYDYDAEPEQPWETICDEHGTVCSHETRAVATSFMAAPEEWCEGCMAECERPVAAIVVNERSEDDTQAEMLRLWFTLTRPKP